jgi:hypothetical protein
VYVSEYLLSHEPIAVSVIGDPAIVKSIRRIVQKESDVVFVTGDNPEY